MEKRLKCAQINTEVICRRAFTTCDDAAVVLTFCSFLNNHLLEIEVK